MGVRVGLSAGLLSVAIFSIGPFIGAEAVDDPAPDPDPKLALVDKGGLDVTGDSTASAERDRLQAVLEPWQKFDGGVVWDPERASMTVQMTSQEALDQAKKAISAAGP